MILECNGNSLVLAEKSPQRLRLRMKQKIHLTYSGDYYGAGYGAIDYRIRANGLIKSQATLEDTMQFLENVDDNKVYYTDHNGQKWVCYMNPDRQSIRRRSREVWDFEISMIGTQL